jgi:polysaccharide export outer membrane protein
MRAPAPEILVTAQEAGPDRESRVSSAGASGGGATTEGPAYRFKEGDAVIINVSGIMPPQSIEDIVDERGFISLPYVGQLKAADLTASELEEVVHRAYVPDYYKYATISVFVPARGYYIRGEVRSPGRFPLVPGITILQAVATAGGYTEFASPRRVRILRGGETIKVNLLDLDKHPEKDLPLEARDVIIVPKAWF